MNEPTGSAGDFSGVWYPDPMDVALMATDTTLQNATPTQEELKRFWEKCGFKEHECHNKQCYYSIKHGHLYTPDDKQYGIGAYSLEGSVHDEAFNIKYRGYYPPLNLDNLFKYGWPQLVKKVGLLKAAELLIKWLDEWANVWKVRKPEVTLYHALNKVLEG